MQNSPQPGKKDGESNALQIQGGGSAPAGAVHSFGRAGRAAGDGKPSAAGAERRAGGPACRTAGAERGIGQGCREVRGRKYRPCRGEPSVTEAERRAGDPACRFGGAEPGAGGTGRTGGAFCRGRTSCATTARRSRRISALPQVRHPVGDWKACRALGRAAGPPPPHQPANATAGPAMGLLRPSRSSAGHIPTLQTVRRVYPAAVQPAVQRANGVACKPTAQLERPAVQRANEVACKPTAQLERPAVQRANEVACKPTGHFTGIRNRKTPETA